MKRVFFVISACMWCATMWCQTVSAIYQAYIDQYRSIAIEQQRKYGVPASITMAQAILESAAGKSELATQANNHFGIKCTSDWVGKTYNHDDDRPNECFRKYAEASDSYEDHSLFLKRKRYESLFALSVGDYKNWAYGLKECGYATDPKYPEKLIRLIELYDLNKLTFDENLVKSGAVNENKLNLEETDITFVDNDHVEAYPMPPMEELELFHNHRSGRCNGVRYIVAGPYETFASLALFLNMYERTLRKYNDALDTRELKEGDIVYIYPKKKRAERRYPSHYFRTGENAWEIAQKYGIKLKSLYKLNGIPYGTPLTTQQRLDLR